MKDKQVKRFNRLIKEQKSLTTVYGDFTFCEQLTDKGLINFAQSLWRHNRLKTLSLNCLQIIRSDKITDKSLAHIGKCLRRFRFLETLALNFSSLSMLKIEGFSRLFRGMKHLKNLKHSSLYFKLSSTIDNSVLEKLSKMLRSTSLLKSLYFDFTSNDCITDLGFLNFSRNLKFFKKGEALHLNFTRCERITNKGFSLLCKGLKLLHPFL